MRVVTEPLTASVLALFVHGPRQTMPGDTEPTPMIGVPEVEALAGLGLQGEPPRHLRRLADGRESKRQVSLIDEGTLRRHRRQFGEFPLAVVKSQVVLEGDLYLPDLLGRLIVFGEAPGAAVLELTIRRDPCEAMDLIASGLRRAMQDGEQGALARVVCGGRIVVGQTVKVL
jgi:hypothetical protein